VKGEFKSCGLCGDPSPYPNPYACQVAVCASCKKRHRLGKFTVCHSCGGTLRCEHAGHHVTIAGAIDPTGKLVAHIVPNMTLCPRCGASIDAHKVAAHYRQVKCREQEAKRRFAKLKAREIPPGAAAILELAGYTRGASDNCQVVDVVAVSKSRGPTVRAIGEAIPAALICRALCAEHIWARTKSDDPDPIMLEARDTLVGFLRDHLRAQTEPGRAAMAILDLVDSDSDLENRHVHTLWSIIRATMGCSRCAVPGELPEVTP